MLTSRDAIQKLIDDPTRFSTVESLHALVDQVSIEASGSLTVLYSGGLGMNASGSTVSVARVIKHLADDGTDIRVIDKTEAAKLLSSVDFEQAVVRVCKSRVEDMGSPANNFLYDAESGAWATVSKRFAAATIGDVITMTPNASLDRTFALVEIPTILESSATTTINGQPIDDVRNDYVRLGRDKNAVTTIVKWLNSTSAQMLLHSDMRIESGAGGVITQIYTGSLFSNFGTPTSEKREGRADQCNYWPNRQVDTSKESIKENLNTIGEPVSEIVSKGTAAGLWSEWENIQQSVKANSADKPTTALPEEDIKKIVRQMGATAPAFVPDRSYLLDSDRLSGDKASIGLYQTALVNHFVDNVTIINPRNPADRTVLADCSVQRMTDGTPVVQRPADANQTEPTKFLLLTNQNEPGFFGVESKHLMEVDNRPGNYYVAFAKENKRQPTLALGPFGQHIDALLHLRNMAAYVATNESTAAKEYSYAALRLPDSVTNPPVGKFNEVLQLDEDLLNRTHPVCPSSELIQ